FRSEFRRLVALHLHHTTSPCSSLSPHVVVRPNGLRIASTSPSPRTRSVESLSLVFPKSGAELEVPGSGFGSLRVCGSSRAGYFFSLLPLKCSSTGFGTGVTSGIGATPLHLKCSSTLAM